MSLRDDMEADVDRILMNDEDFGDGSYIPGGDDSPSITVVTNPVIDQATGKVIASQRAFMCSRADLASPRSGDRGSLNGRATIIRKIEDGGPGAWIITVSLEPGGPA